MICPSCGNRNPSQARFCNRCGASLRFSALEKLKKLVEQGRHEQALKQFPQMSKEELGHAELLAWWGHALYFSGRSEEALSKYLEALEKDPQRWDAAFQAAFLHYGQGRFQESEAYFERLLALEPDLKGSPLAAAFSGDVQKLLSNAHLHLGLAQKSQGKSEKAERHLHEAARLDSRNPLAIGVLGDLHASKGEFAAAAESYRKALDLVQDLPRQLALHNDLGVAYFHAGRFSEAAEEFKWVIRRDPRSQNAIYNLGVLYLKQGLGEGTQQDWNEFLKSDDAAGIFLGLTRSVVEAAHKEAGEREFPGMVGNSRGMKEVFELIRRASASDATVLILGENGTGKELVARAVHQSGPRKGRAFVAINCGAVPEGLLESELFGYEKGAFTGAYRAKPGRFELAEGGTLFLDEIGDLDPALQVKLLRVLQEKTFERLGGVQTLKANVRLIAATHRALRRKVADGSFREDLFYRLNVIPIQLPPLRDRKEDIPELAGFFLARHSLQNRKRFATIHPEALQLLARQDWPGNVRQLENVIERAVALYDDTILLPMYLSMDELKEASLSLPPQAPESGEQGVAAGLNQVEVAERQVLVDQLRKSGYKVALAAKALGMSQATLYRKLNRFHVNPKEKLLS